MAGIRAGAARSQICAQWLEPYTEPSVIRLAAEGIKHLDAICPGFAADNLETLEEIGIEARDAFLAAGGAQFNVVPCLNDAPDWIAALGDLSERHLQGWPTRVMPDATALAAQRQRALALGATD